MKLSEYIMNEYKAGSSALSSEDIDRWIEEWYSIKYGRLPPTWLVKGEVGDIKRVLVKGEKDEI